MPVPDKETTCDGCYPNQTTETRRIDAAANGSRVTSSHRRSLSAFWSFLRSQWPIRRGSPFTSGISSHRRNSLGSTTSSGCSRTRWPISASTTARSTRSFAVPIQLVISFTLAMILVQKIRARDFYRAGFYLPIIVPLVAWSVVWQRMFHIQYGIFNIILGWFGIAGQAVADRSSVWPSRPDHHVVLDDRPPDGHLHCRVDQHPPTAAGGSQHRRGQRIPAYRSQ